MKLRYILFLILALSCLTFAQKKRYLISPYQEVIPLDKDESARMAMVARHRTDPRVSSDTCTNTVYDGFTPAGFPGNANFAGTHKDVLGEWFVSRFTGSIDTIFWETYSAVGALDSLVYIRVNKSNITPTAGPGVRPGPFNPPCQDWGYWKNTADLDQGVAAFPDDASDTNWVSTINITQPGIGVKSFEPFGKELWGLGGDPVVDHGPFLINAVPMTDTPLPLNVKVGDVFFISQKVNGPATHPVPIDARTEMLAWGLNNTVIPPEYKEFYPSRDWKFYEHDSGPSNCAGQTPANVKRGWVARGGFFQNDSNDIGAYDIWYSITTNDNTPPFMISNNASDLVNTFDTGPQTFTCELGDCDPANAGLAGVASASISLSINGTYVGAIPMTNSGGNQWIGDIPGQPVWTNVSFSIVATDLEGLVSSFPAGSYRVCATSNSYAEETLADGPAATQKLKPHLVSSVTDGCTSLDISGSGTEIPVASFFKGKTAVATTNPYDDGTAGPFALSSPFFLFGKALNYAWVGVNGAISLTETAADTNDVNSAGFYQTGWTFPASIRANDRDTGASLLMPRNFIAPWWEDLIYGDTSHPTIKFGHIYYKDNGSQFIVQWGPGIGVFQQNGNPFLDALINFRVVLNKTDGTIAFQYDNIGSSGLDTLGLIGMQADSSARARLDSTVAWMFCNYNGNPVDYRPQSGRCITIYQKGTSLVNDKWNMVSVPNVPRNNNFLKTNVYPTATSSAFAFSGGYLAKDTLANASGYWAKFNGKQFVGASGSILNTLNVPVAAGWNMVGSISCPVTTSSITDPTVNGQTYYGFNNGYNAVTTLNPGGGYWVKAGTTGSFTMTCATSGSTAKLDQNYSQLNGFSKIAVHDNRGGQQTLYIGDATSLKVPLERYELPPVPPSGIFDARFVSGRTVEVYGSDLNSTGSYTISIQSSAYPLMLQYTNADKGKSFVISENSNGKSVSNTILNGKGTIRITNPAVTSISVKVIDGSTTPRQFALSQNYPNPFNPVTRFSVDVPVSGNVDISVFNVLGQKVSTILSGNQDAGYLTIEWDGKDNAGMSSPSGIYFVRMTAGDFAQVRKVMLLK